MVAYIYADVHVVVQIVQSSIELFRDISLVLELRSIVIIIALLLWYYKLLFDRRTHHPGDRLVYLRITIRHGRWPW